MGTWNTKITGNDTTLDVYSNFLDLYNEGANPVNVSEQIKEDFQEYFNDSDDRNNSLFGLALAQWETKCLEKEVFDSVKSIIENGTDLQLWSDLGADEKTIRKREKELQKFLTQISIERPKAKRRVRPKFEFTVNELINEIAPDNKKVFGMNEEFTNQKYIHTGGIMSWMSGGGSGIVYFEGQGKRISAKWIDSQTLEITHEKGLIFTKKEERSFFCGDEVIIKYKEE